MNYQPKKEYKFDPELLKDIIPKKEVVDSVVEVKKPITKLTLTRRIKKMEGQYKRLFRTDTDLKKFNQIEITVEEDYIKVLMNSTKKPGQLSHMEKEIPITESLDHIKRLAERIRRSINK